MLCLGSYSTYVSLNLAKTKLEQYTSQTGVVEEWEGFFYSFLLINKNVFNVVIFATLLNPNWTPN